MEIWLTGLPMPPSQNAQLRPQWKTGRFIKTKDAISYTKAIEYWIVKNYRQVQLVRALANRWVDCNFMIETELFLCFPKSKLITKDGKPKRLDSNNRIKSCIDGIYEVLGIDDKYNGKEQCQTIVIEANQQSSADPHVIARLKPFCRQSLSTTIPLSVLQQVSKGVIFCE